MSLRIKSTARPPEFNKGGLKTRTLRALLCAVAIVFSGCAGHPVSESETVDGIAETALELMACRDALSRTVSRNHVASIDPRSLRVATWNVQKAANTGWHDEFAALAAGRDLVLIQEALPSAHDRVGEQGLPYGAFAPGYRWRGETTGVLTFSNSQPVARCSLTSREPVLRTPKATSITQYTLDGTSETLVVVNVHAVNFSLGLGAFRQQFEQIAAILAAHSGPIILAGDFNTWRSKRERIVDEISLRLDLAPLHYADDRRSRVFGRALDHIYVRGLSVLETGTHDFSTSDHNPVTATLSM